MMIPRGELARLLTAKVSLLGLVKSHFPWSLMRVAPLPKAGSSEARVSVRVFSERKNYGKIVCNI